MTSHSRAELPNLRSIATVPTPAPWTVFFRSLRCAVSRGLTIARPRIACVLGGHERWTAKSGDWVCMRCGKLEVLDVPQNPTRLGNRARANDLPRFE